MKKYYILIIIFFIVNISCISPNLTINIPENHFGIDDENSIIISHIEDIADYTNLLIYNKLVINIGNENFIFNTIPNNLEYSASYQITSTNTSNQYTLYFTQLPIISIISSGEILDEPKILANFIYSDDSQILNSLIGIELRGATSLTYPKKNYDHEFWEDSIGNETHNVQFANLRSDDDWILNGLYNEPLRLRSYTANKLWLKLYTPSYIADEPEAKSGANVEYVEIFVNNKYNGIYNLSEQVDKKQLKLKSFKNGNIRGELYKGIDSVEASIFTNLPPYDNTIRTWGGFEFKYPKANEITDWANLYELVDFVINSTDDNFTNNIWDKFDIENYSSYFIFLNLLRATDNTGKNLYLAKYNANTNYFYVPWDLDGCFGTNYSGINENIFDDTLYNGLINRVIELNPNNVFEDIEEKWFNCRNNIFHYDTLANNITNQYNFLLTNKIYERESVIYPNYPFSQEDLTYTLEWLNNRLAFLDNYFNNLSSKKNANYKDKAISIFPNPAKNLIYINNVNSLNKKEFILYNSLGQLLKKAEIKDNTISIENLAKGYYVLVLDDKRFKFSIN